MRLRGIKVVAHPLRFSLKRLIFRIESARFFTSRIGTLVTKAKVELKTVQGILRNRKRQAMLDLSTQEDGDEPRAAEREFLNGVGMNATIHS